MKIRNSLKSAKVRDKNCRVVRRHGRVYVISGTMCGVVVEVSVGTSARP